MIATKRNTNWQHLENLVHLAGPDAELHITLHNVSPDADGSESDTKVILKCRAGFIRAGQYLFAYPDVHGGGSPGRLDPNVWELKPTDEPHVFEAECLTDSCIENDKPDVEEEVVKQLEAAGYHWEDWAPRD